MESKGYQKASTYEYFIRNAYNCPSGMKNGAHLCFMKNAMSMEKGETSARHLGTYEKQFKKVKDYVSKALIKYSKTKPYSIHSNHFLNLNNQLEYKSTTNELMVIIEDAFEKVLELKNIN